MKFSLIVPVCGTENYLEQCLGTIKSQEFTDFECLVINDGSKGVKKENFKLWQDDKFEPILDLDSVDEKSQCKFVFDFIVGDDSRFKLFTQSNQGVSAAKNYGLTQANGDYIQIIDSDDALTSDFLSLINQQLVDSRKKVALPYFLISKCYNSDYIIPRVYVPKRITVANAYIYPILMAWNFVMLNSIIKKYNLKFEERLGPGPFREDKIIKHGYDDTLFSALYTDALVAEYGIDNINITQYHNESYLYRDVNLKTKEILSDPESIERFYTYLGACMSKSNDYKSRHLSSVVVKWNKLWQSNNPFDKIQKKAITLYIRNKVK